MSRFLRINKTVIHVPSLANVNMNVNCFGYPVLCLHYHTHALQTITFTKYEDCEKQMMRVKTAMKVIECELEAIPLVEPAEQEVPPLNTTNVLPA